MLLSYAVDGRAAMKVLYDGTIYNSQASGGISRYYTNLIAEMSTIRPSWQFLIHINENPLSQPPCGENIVTSCRRHNRPRALMFPVNYARREWMALKAGADLFHSTLGRPVRLARLPVVATIHDAIEFVVPEHYTQRNRSKKWKKWCARNADAIITISEQSKKDIVKYLGADPGRISVIHLAACESFGVSQTDRIASFRERLSLDRPYVLYVGHRGEHKNFGVLRKAFEDPRLLPYDLVVGGGAPLGSEETTPLRAGQLKHIARPDDESLNLLYAGAHAFVFPSLYEGFGIPLVEAMRCGAPIVASRIPTSEEVCGDCCEYFPSTSSAALTEALIGLEDQGRRQELIERGLKRSRRYSWKNCAEETINLYNATARARSQT